MNQHVVQKPNNFDGRTFDRITKVPKDSKALRTTSLLPRKQLRLHCATCQFEWIYDTLTVRCLSDPEAHNQREQWLHPTWMWGKQQPYRYYEYLPATINPRTGMLLAREDARSMNNERRGQGLTTRTLNTEKERRGIARSVSKIASGRMHWRVRFPFPT